MEYMSEAKKRKVKLKDLEEYRTRIDLIQDLDFAISSQKIRVTRDNNYILATGVYPPRLKIYDTRELSMKCERGIDAEVIQLIDIADDYSKIAILCGDRNIELHAQYGRHFKIRIPRFGRDMVYNQHSSDLITCGEGNEIYRLNLSLGRFQAPFVSSCLDLNCIDYCP